MANLSTLPADLRLKIVHHLIPTGDTAWEISLRRLDIPHLALVCRSMNETCGTIIFRKYTLALRSNKFYKAYPQGSSLARWDEKAIQLRLAHLRSKAPYVRHLWLVDDGKYMGVRPPDIATVSVSNTLNLMPELLSTLKALTQVMSVTLVASHDGITPPTLIPLGLWDWLVQASLLDVKLSGEFGIAPGQHLQPLKTLRALTVERTTYPGNETCNSIIDTLHPTRLVINYANIFSGDFPVLKPIDPILEHIEIAIYLPPIPFDEPMFDFSAIPQATISVTVTIRVGHPWAHSYEGGWNKAKAKLFKMFVEDLRGFDVKRSWTPSGDVVEVSRSPGRGWEPTRHDDLEDWG
ncbi:hypothetical protein FPV67DRAFT_300730 [Lyophyllum atratum]|nr:hypothetical protein FPV67DRAFT_300730 [Lyophyllum atratum]